MIGGKQHEFLYKRLVKLAELSAKKDMEQKYDYLQLTSKELTSEELNYLRTTPTDQWRTNDK